MENPSTNIFVKISSGDNPVKTFKIIDDLAELKGTSVEPAKIIVNPYTVVTFYFDESVGREVAIASTVVLKKAIEIEIKNDDMKFGLFGCLDHNISFKAIPRKEFAIYFNAVVDHEKIQDLLSFFEGSLKASVVGKHYGYEPPKVFVFQLFMLPDVFGFWRSELDSASELCAAHTELI